MIIILGINTNFLYSKISPEASKSTIAEMWVRTKYFYKAQNYVEARFMAPQESLSYGN